MDLGVEDRDALPVTGQDVGVAVREPGDEAFEAQPAQIVGHLRAGVVGAEQPGDVAAEPLVGDPADHVAGDGEGAGQGHDPRVAEPQGWGPPPVHHGRRRDPLKGWARKDTTLTDALMV